MDLIANFIYTHVNTYTINMHKHILIFIGKITKPLILITRVRFQYMYHSIKTKFIAPGVTN